MKKKNQRISDLFYNNRFLFVFSVVVAVITWLVVAVEFAETENIIKNVPVQIDYSRIQDNLGGLEPFGETEFFVDVTISGKRHIVESDDVKDDLVVTANTSYVSSVGTYSLNLAVTSASVRPEYDVVGTSTNSIDVYFDYYKEKEFKVEADIDFASPAVPEGYHMDNFILSNAATVKVSGPETEINKIKAVSAKATNEGNLRQSQTVDAILTAVTVDGSTPKYISFNRQSEKIQITIPVYKIATLPVTCGFSNAPSEYLGNMPFSVSISPATVTFGVPENELAGKTSMELATKIDFSELKTGVNTFNVKATGGEIVGGIVLDETQEFIITVKVGGMSSKTVAAPQNVSFINVPDGLVTETSSLNFSEMTVIGPQEKLDLITADSINLVADFSDIDENASDVVTVPVRISDGSCWSYGFYTVTATIS